MYKSCLTSVDYLIYCTPPPHHSGKYLRNITSHRNVKGYWRAEAGASVRIMVWVQQCTPSILWRVGGPALTTWEKVIEAIVNHAWRPTTRDSHSAFGSGRNVGNSSTSPRFTRIDTARGTRSSLKHQTTRSI